MILPFAEQVTWFQVDEPAEDDTGNEVAAFKPARVVEAAVWPTVSDESNQPQDIVTRGLSLLFPGVQPITGSDEFQVRGARYRVDGDPDIYHSPLTGTEVTHVQLLRRT